MKVRNTTLKEYVSGIDNEQVNYAFKYGTLEPVDTFKIGDIMSQPFGIVKDAQYMFNKTGATLDKYVSFLIDNLEINKNVVVNESIYKIEMSRRFLAQCIISVNNLESKSLGHVPTSEEIAAGIEDFDIFGNYSQFRMLAGGGDYDKIESVKKWPYSFCFAELKYSKTESDFNKRLNKIMSKKK